ncbi:MAG TPA: phosphatidylinositol mannoside acyltransferase, partial [Acidimicrobiales bacterium]|nr:phosphatidylinositol mannoside acyltransferase [Acidimicrobiales bacterium]
MADVRKQFVYYVYRISTALLQMFPRAVVIHIGDRVGWALAMTSPRRHAVVTENLRHVVGQAMAERELKRVVRRAFSSYGRYWAESALLVAANRASFVADTDIVGRSHLDEAIARGNGVILTLPHVGSWEVGGLYLVDQGIPVTGVAEVVEPPELFDWFVARRAALGLTALPLGRDAAAQSLRELHRGGVIVLLADRDILGDGVDVEFFGERTRLPRGPALLALRSGAALLPCAVYQRPQGRYRLHVRPAIDVSRKGRLRDDVAALTQEVAHELEELIRPAPEQWHVFQPNWPELSSAKPHLS